MALTLHGTVSDNTAVLDRRSAKPIIINGDMQVAQRATSVTGVTAAGYRTVDRFHINIDTMGTWTISQADDAPTGSGFQHSLKLDCTTADASPAAGDNITINTRLEGQDLQLFKKGTSSAEKFTVSFWVKATKTGTHILELDDNDNGRNINQAYTINSSNTWEKKVLTFAADTTGAFDNDNGSSLRLFWWVGAGSNFTSGTLETSWASTTNANRAVGQVNNADSTSNEWYITGVQLEVGEFDANSIAPFQHESYGDNLARCHRYFFRKVSGNDKSISGGAYYSSTIVTCNVDFPTEMRTAPSTIQETGTDYYGIFAGGTFDTFNSFTATFSAGNTGVALDCNANVSGTQGDGGRIKSNNASSFLGFEAEL